MAFRTDNKNNRIEKDGMVCDGSLETRRMEQNAEKSNGILLKSADTVVGEI